MRGLVDTLPNRPLEEDEAEVLFQKTTARFLPDICWRADENVRFVAATYHRQDGRAVSIGYSRNSGQWEQFDANEITDDPSESAGRTSEFLHENYGEGEIEDMELAMDYLQRFSQVPMEAWMQP
ncbi:hypothetical protein [Halalkalicoccus jeotgali]|uniref:Uncharacterized protein n=1 Tax=Halalkalicoccus jeotgali (strain DSM 18796 / CECT 7217 / JCM 14584 / KCTC 4019 / B3) TaxID=795797 RepID=D8J9L3_HALJB|nr:hypothetical protein [Halalkalicoccus jeotgali]ADJ14425.1 hypothetical protein HacjB3_05170 [Halalkalicoccus jeotgali B3]ELY40141.1 hypothetical protein C497_03555 [Halalkalicoccus jeotgali B3]